MLRRLSLPMMACEVSPSASNSRILGLAYPQKNLAS